MNKNKNTITETKFFFDIEKEFDYINEMNKKGWKLNYIKGGMLYTFTKTEPDEYITVMHIDEKEKISEVAAFAAQCGYENIPHTMDGMGTVMYLTGKKTEVSREFVNDTSAKVKVYERLKKIFTVLSAVFIIFNLILCVEAVMISKAIIDFAEYDSFLTGFGIFIIVFTIFYTALDVYAIILRQRYSKKVKELSAESNIYE